jgi:hypothetical protein
MTTSQTDNDAKKLGGYLKEKLTIAWTRFSDDELVRAVTKVASHMLKIPNEKHMQRLINATYGQYNSGGTDYGDVNKWMVEALESHLHAHNWVVVLKTALAFHRLMADGSDAFNTAVQNRRGLFSLSHIKDLADSPDGAEQQIFVTHYLRYLEERQIAQLANAQRLKNMRIENQAFANQLLSIVGREAVTVTSSILLQFETAIDVQFIPHAVNNFATLQGHRNCLNDAKLLFVAISRKMVNILEKIEGFTPEEREAWLPIYKRYSLASRKFAARLTEMKNSRVSWGEDLPTIRPLPDDILEQLASVLDPKYQPRNVGTGELPVVKLSDITRANNTNTNERSHTPPTVLDGQVILQQDNKKTHDALHDIFSPDNKNSVNKTANGGGAGGAMPDLFSNGPSKPANTGGGNNNNVDLFGGNNNNSKLSAPPPQPGNKNNFDDLFGGNPNSTNNNNRNNNNDFFAGATTSNNNNNQHHQQQQQKAHVPLDPFATITSATAQPYQKPAQTQQQQTSGSGAGGLDFFATPSTTNNNNNNQYNNNNKAQPAFDPFAPSDASGRQKAW